MTSTQELPGEQRIKIVDMQREMIAEAFRVAGEALSKHQIDQEVAKHIKQHFDRRYYPNWHCIVGKSFTSVVTYESRHYIHFDIDDKSVILFKFG